MIKMDNQYENLNGVELLNIIATRDVNLQDAEMAFVIFCNRYQRDILQKSEIYCNRYCHNEVVAEMAAKCTFDKVWKKAHTFDIKKAKAKSIDNAIRNWLIRILYTQIIKFKDRTECAEPTIDEDLSLIYNVDQMIEYVCAENIETRGMLMQQMMKIEKIFEKLSDKHRIIYLTYKVYRQDPGKTIPRSISKKLKEELELTSSTIRVYLTQAEQLITSQLQ